MSVAVACRNLCFTHVARRGAGVQTIRNFSCDIAAGQFVSIVGPSGCGKTTLLRLMGGLLAPTEGEVHFPGHPGGRAPVSVVFQEHGVFPWMTVQDNAAFGLAMQGMARPARLARAHAILDRVGLTPFRESFPHELSVGMRQRVGIARAFVTGAPILLMDEPFGALDAQTKLVLQEEVLRLWRDDRKVVVFVTHDIEEAVRLGDRVLVLSARPTTIVEEIVVSRPRPRPLVSGDADTVAQVARIWSLLEADVRRSLPT